MKGQSGTSGRVVCSLHGAGGANSRALGIIIIFKLREQLLKTKLNKQTKTRLLTFTHTSPSWETPRQIFSPPASYCTVWTAHAARDGQFGPLCCTLSKFTEVMRAISAVYVR